VTYGTYAYGYGTTYAAAAQDWTAAEIDQAHPAVPPAAYPAAGAYTDDHPATSDMVYPRTYTRTAEPYGNVYRHR
jgi:hypothetical protein